MSADILTLVEVKQTITTNPKLSIHRIIHNKYDIFGYDAVIESVKNLLKISNLNGSEIALDYLNSLIQINNRFNSHKAVILPLLLDENCDKLEEWV
jgi:hypothetical protein